MCLLCLVPAASLRSELWPLCSFCTRKFKYRECKWIYERLIIWTADISCKNKCRDNVALRGSRQFFSHFPKASVPFLPRLKVQCMNEISWTVNKWSHTSSTSLRLDSVPLARPSSVFRGWIDAVSWSPFPSCSTAVFHAFAPSIPRAPVSIYRCNQVIDIRNTVENWI